MVSSLGLAILTSLTIFAALGGQLSREVEGSGGVVG